MCVCVYISHNPKPKQIKDLFSYFVQIILYNIIAKPNYMNSTFVRSYQEVCYTMALPFTLKKYLKVKEEL